jgi:hypothetical protein
MSAHYTVCGIDIDITGPATTTFSFVTITAIAACKAPNK